MDVDQTKEILSDKEFSWGLLGKLRLERVDASQAIGRQSLGKRPSKTIFQNLHNREGEKHTSRKMETQKSSLTLVRSWVEDERSARILQHGVRALRALGG